MKELTPKAIVQELDKYVVGQEEAKRCVGIALRNRWRRQQLPAELRDEVAPKNIIMIGPTGVGKTEIARRLANLAKAPFLKIEASRYTEIGYHGRDVESMIRDLVEISVRMVRQEQTQIVSDKAKKVVEEKLLDLLIASSNLHSSEESNKIVLSQGHEEPKIDDKEQEIQRENRERMRKELQEGKLENCMVEVGIEERNAPMVEIFSNASVEQIGMDIQSMFEKVIPSRHYSKKVSIVEARNILLQQESDNLIDKETMIKEALHRAENMGIIFIDEIDKIVGTEEKHGPDVSREGVQRDLLPIVEGATVMTRYGMAKTDHILFISAGAFSHSKPSDLIPELQGRFPIRVELKPLTSKEFMRILQEPKNALLKQYQALLQTENISLSFDLEAIQEIAKICEDVNQRMQNIGARRLHTIIEKLLEEILFDAPDIAPKEITVTSKMVKEKLADIIKDEDLSRYIL